MITTLDHASPAWEAIPGAHRTELQSLMDALRNPPQKNLVAWFHTQATALGISPQSFRRHYYNLRNSGGDWKVLVDKRQSGSHRAEQALTRTAAFAAELVRRVEKHQRKNVPAFRELRKDWTVEVVHGATSKTARDEIFRQFQTATDPRVLVANAQTMSHGLTLTAATTIIWYAPVHSNETYEQSCARVRRPGQTRTTVIAHIAGSDIERKVYKRLSEKQSMQGILLEMMKEKTD
jgi:hypothetical protein